jgi:uncharacterized protein (TIGR00375 family)
MLKEFFADLHIHIGAGSNGKAVKITASKDLSFENILNESLNRKGLDMIGIIDCASPIVIRDIDNLLKNSEMEELESGGILYRKKLVIITGVEVESREENGGQAHYLAYFPYLENIKKFSNLMKKYIKNINLSTQTTGLNGSEILEIVDNLEGILVPAHIFTPHKSFYGRSFSTYKEVFSEEEWSKILAVELGLSADTYLADYISELKNKTFLSNSDAHSLGKIAREYNKLRLQDLNFKEFIMALKFINGRGIAANYGLDPRLGKYHRSYCPNCEKSFPFKEPVYKCPECGEDKIIIGVKDRIIRISDRGFSISPESRPEYIYQIPLSDIPGIGRKTIDKLLGYYGNEMNILHKTNKDELMNIVSSRIAENIIKSSTGKMEIIPGGGGYYGKVIS